jgi:hypothetical protein
LQGYAAVFLSFGNYGLDYTEFNSAMANAVVNYLENGGYLYLEGGDALGYDQASNTLLLQLMGLASTQDGTNNEIDSLYGQPDALTGDLYFTGSSQPTNVYIDTFTPLGDAVAALVESDYGTVGVQSTGSYGQRTICFSYTLADLEDGEYPNTREELLQRICNFFDIYTRVAHAENGEPEFDLFPNPCSSRAMVNFSLEEGSPVRIDILDMQGRNLQTVMDEYVTQGQYTRSIDLEGLQGGVYFVVLRAREAAWSRKLILIK